MGSSFGASLALMAGAAAPAAAAASRALVSRSILRASHAAPPASPRKGSMGMPGRSAIAPITAADMPSAFG
jgi:hypothetical protein